MEQCGVVHGLVLQPNAIRWEDRQHMTQERILEQPCSCWIQQGHHDSPHRGVEGVQDSLHMIPSTLEEIARAQALCEDGPCAWQGAAASAQGIAG